MKRLATIITALAVPFVANAAFLLQTNTATLDIAARSPDYGDKTFRVQGFADQAFHYSVQYDGSDYSVNGYYGLWKVTAQKSSVTNRDYIIKGISDITVTNNDMTFTVSRYSIPPSYGNYKWELLLLDQATTNLVTSLGSGKLVVDGSLYASDADFPYPAPSVNLADLADVSSGTGWSLGDILVYNGTSWVAGESSNAPANNLSTTNFGQGTVTFAGDVEVASNLTVTTINGSSYTGGVWATDASGVYRANGNVSIGGTNRSNVGLQLINTYGSGNTPFLLRDNGGTQRVRFNQDGVGYFAGGLDTPGDIDGDNIEGTGLVQGANVRSTGHSRSVTFEPIAAAADLHLHLRNNNYEFVLSDSNSSEVVTIDASGNVMASGTVTVVDSLSVSTNIYASTAFIGTFLAVSNGVIVLNTGAMSGIMYDALGTYSIYGTGGSIVMRSGDANYIMDSDGMELNGILDLDGDLDISGDVSTDLNVTADISATNITAYGGISVADGTVSITGDADGSTTILLDVQGISGVTTDDLLQRWGRAADNNEASIDGTGVFRCDGNVVAKGGSATLAGGALEVNGSPAKFVNAAAVQDLAVSCNGGTLKLGYVSGAISTDVEIYADGTNTVTFNPADGTGGTLVIDEATSDGTAIDATAGYILGLPTLGQLYMDGSQVQDIAGGGVYQCITNMTSTNLVGVTATHSNLTVGVAGYYYASFSVSFGGATSEEYEFAIHNNGAEIHNIEGERRTSNNDIGSCAGGGNTLLSANDVLDLRVKSNTGAADFDPKKVQLTLHRLN